MPWFVSDDTPPGVEGTGEVSFGAIVDDVPPVYAGAALAAGAFAPVDAGAALAAGAVVAGVVADAEAELAGGAVTVSVADAAGAAGAAGALYSVGGRLYITVGVSDVIGRLDHERG